MSSEKQNLKQRLREKARLSPEQTEKVLKWLSRHPDKKISFNLMFNKDIEMMLESGIIQKNENKNVQSWAWNQIKGWTDRQGDSL